MPGIKVENGATEEAYPELFDTRAMLPQPKEKKPGQLPDELIRKYFEEGFVVLENFFTKEELDPCRKETERLVDDLARKLFDAGKISNLHEDSGLFERLTKIEEEFPGANVILHKLACPPDAYKQLWTNRRLLNVIEQLIGPDIAGNPVWNLRTKTPQNEATTVPWHQDSGYNDNRSYKTHIPTAWIPLLDANEVNGCLQFAARGHRSGKIATHQSCWRDTWYISIEDEEMKQKLGVDLDKDLVIAPVPYGGLVLFNNLIPHRSLPNLSSDIRWSLDLRWQCSGDPDCFWGVKDPVVMRKKDDPGYQVDWTKFDSVDRHSNPDKPAEDPFDTTISGPWMGKWEIVHTNKHVERYLRDEGLPIPTNVQ